MWTLAITNPGTWFVVTNIAAVALGRINNVPKTLHVYFSAALRIKFYHW